MATKEYMQEYLDDPDHPERREKKRERDNLRYATDPVHRERMKQRARDHYAANREERKLAIAKRSYLRKVQATLLLGGKCMWPGCEVTHPAALQFHHRDPDQKKFTLDNHVWGSPKKYPWELVKAELAKCDLLCANHHFIHHSNWNEEWLDDLVLLDDQLV